MVCSSALDHLPQLDRQHALQRCARFQGAPWCKAESMVEPLLCKGPLQITHHHINYDLAPIRQRGYALRCPKFQVHKWSAYRHFDYENIGSRFFLNFRHWFEACCDSSSSWRWLVISLVHLWVHSSETVFTFNRLIDQFYTYLA